MTETGIRDNLRSAGCSHEMIERFEQSHDDRMRLALLVCYRKVLLKSLHAEQRKLDYLDYLIFNLKKGKEGNQHGKQGKKL